VKDRLAFWCEQCPIASTPEVGGFHYAGTEDDAWPLEVAAPILTVADRGGTKLFQRLPNRQSASLMRAMKPFCRRMPFFARMAPAVMRQSQQAAVLNTSWLVTHRGRASERAVFTSRT
jgi:hypothetical protein